MSRMAEAKNTCRFSRGSIAYGAWRANANPQSKKINKSSFVFMVLPIFLVACGGGDTPLSCSERPRACVQILEQINVPAEEGAEARFAIRLVNECAESVDLKLCFEDNQGRADCREHSEVPQGRVIRENKEERFTGPGIKLFVRYSSEAKYCGFPLTNTVGF
jgi:hypothetical protein